MKIVYFDCFSGISGDMCLGALVDAGVPLKKLVTELKKIPVRGYEIHSKKVKRAGISSTKIDVIPRFGSTSTYLTLANGSDPAHPPLANGRSMEGLMSKKPRTKGRVQALKTWKDIEKIINKSSLSKEIKEKGLKVFERLFKAEAKIHGNTFQHVHLHELGAIDCLLDVFGTIIGLDFLAVEKVYSSPVNLGSGSLKTEHRILPVPAPASTEILKGVPVYSTDTKLELTTPTGAALVSELSSEFGNIPLMNIETIGLGAGTNNFKDRPNVLRLFVGTMVTFPSTPLWQRVARGDLKGGPINLSNEMITVIETNIDDMNPQVYEYVMEKLFQAGALDVFLTQILMKKGRPGTLLTVLCNETDREDMIKIILTETTTIGLRFYDVGRRVLEREIKLIDTEFGKVRVKFSRLAEDILKATPEYEDYRKIAKKLNMPLIEVMRMIRIPPNK